MESQNTARHCANCDSVFYHRPKIVNKRPELPTDSSQKKLVETITLKSALKTLYKLNYLDDLQNSLDKANPPSLNEKEEEEDGTLCGRCSKVFLNLLVYYYQFNSLRVVNSRLSKRILKLDELIRLIQCLIDTQVERDQNPNPPKVPSQGEGEQNENNNSTTTTTIVTEFLPTITVSSLMGEEDGPSQPKKTKSDELVDEPKSPAAFLDIESSSNLDGGGEDDEDSSDIEMVNLEEESPEPTTSSETNTKFLPSNRVTHIKDSMCPICQERFFVPENLTTHLITHIKDPTIHDCPVPNCSNTFNERGPLISHLKSHAEDVRYNCPSCPQTFALLSQKIEHLPVHYSEGIYVCGRFKCDLIFSTKEILDSHWTSIHAQSKRGYPCPACPGRFFRKEEGLDRHIQSSHRNQSIYACPACSESFSVKIELTDHWQCHGINIQPNSFSK